MLLLKQLNMSSADVACCYALRFNTKLTLPCLKMFGPKSEILSWTNLSWSKHSEASENQFVVDRPNAQQKADDFSREKNSEGLKRQEKMHLKMSSVEVVCYK